MANLVQFNNKGASGTTTTNLTLGSVTAGNTIICYVMSTAGARTFTVSDSINGAYNQDRTGNTLVSAAIFSFPGAGSGAPTVTMTVSGANTTIQMMVEEWSGILTPTPLDKATGASTASNTTATSASTGTLSQAAELAVAMCGTAGGTSGLAIQGAYSVSPASLGGISACGNQQPNSTAALTATFNWTTNASSQIHLVTYKLVTLVNPPLYTRKYILYNT